MGKKLKRRIAVIFISAGVAVAVILLLDGLLSTTAKRVSAGAEQHIITKAVDFLKGYGYECGSGPAEVFDYTVPTEFDSVMTIYNDLQKSQGFDLEKYKGKTVKRFSFKIENYPDVAEDVFADILFSDGEIIGGDIPRFSVIADLVPAARQIRPRDAERRVLVSESHQFGVFVRACPDVDVFFAVDDRSAIACVRVFRLFQIHIHAVHIARFALVLDLMPLRIHIRCKDLDDRPLLKSSDAAAVRGSALSECNAVRVDHARLIGGRMAYGERQLGQH